jgi:PAS domain S-box-containing protein
MRLWEVLKDSQSVGALQIDVNRKIRHCNHHAAEMFGLDIIGLVGSSIINLTAPEDRAKTYERFEAIDSGSVHHSRTTKTYVNATGGRFVVSLEFWPIFDNETVTSIEAIIYQLPHGNRDSEMLAMQQQLTMVNEIVMSLLKNTNTPAPIVNVGGANATGGSGGTGGSILQKPQ